jgi:hypothetical protein
MAFHVRIHQIARESMEAWARSLATDPTSARALANVYYEVIKSELIKSKGRPEGSEQIIGISPETRAWDFQIARYWIIYVVRRQKRKGRLSRLFPWRDWEAVILRFQSRRPTRSTLGLLPTDMNGPDR